jgi:hypothetical protein
VCELRNLRFEKRVHLYGIEIGDFGGEQCGGGWLSASGRAYWRGSGWCSTFSQIHHPLVVSEMQKAVCVQAVPVGGGLRFLAGVKTSKSKPQRINSFAFAENVECVAVSEGEARTSVAFSAQARFPVPLTPSEPFVEIGREAW